MMTQKMNNSLDKLSFCDLELTFVRRFCEGRRLVESKERSGGRNETTDIVIEYVKSCRLHFRSS